MYNEVDDARKGHSVMAETGDHERRIAQLEGEFKSVAKKEDLVQLKYDLTKAFQDSSGGVRREISEEIKVFRQEIGREIKGLHGEIKELREKQHRWVGASDLIKFALPLIISIGALAAVILNT